MDIVDWLQLGVVVAACYAVLSLVSLVWRTATAPRKPDYSLASGIESRGIWYAFTKGMLPGEKESVGMHMPTFIGGALYHLGVFAAVSFLIVTLFEIRIPETVLWTIRALVATGIASGFGLLVKRISLRKMRIISTPDDYVANILVDLLLLTALAGSFTANWTPHLLATAMILLIYLPLGKIRHCVMFFYTRVQFGRLFGRRGVLPHPAGEK